VLGVVGVFASQYQCASVHWMVVCVLGPVLAAQLADGVEGEYTLPEPGGVAVVVATLACAAPCVVCLPGVVLASALRAQVGAARG
jgi:hypothetical protein